MTSECRAGRGRPFPAVGCRGCKAEEPAQPGARPAAAAASLASPGLPREGGELQRHTAAPEPGISKAERKAGNLGSDFLATNINSCGAARRLPPGGVRLGGGLTSRSLGLSGFRLSHCFAPCSFLISERVGK